MSRHCKGRAWQPRFPAALCGDYNEHCGISLARHANWPHPFSLWNELPTFYEHLSYTDDYSCIDLYSAYLIVLYYIVTVALRLRSCRMCLAGPKPDLSSITHQHHSILNLQPEDAAWHCVKQWIVNCLHLVDLRDSVLRRSAAVGLAILPGFDVVQLLTRSDLRHFQAIQNDLPAKGGSTASVQRPGCSLADASREYWVHPQCPI